MWRNGRGQKREKNGVVKAVDFTRTKENTRKERRVQLMKERIIERTVNGIKVTSYIPENVSESVKRNRINQIYDILKPVERDEDSKEFTEKSEDKSESDISA